MDWWLHCRKGRVAAAFAGLLAIGCDAVEDGAVARDAPWPVLAPEGAYVGAVDDSDMVVGAAVAGDQLRIYTCAGPAELGRSRWFKGSVADGPFELVNGEWSITGAWVDGRLEGALHTPEGEQLPWSADAVAAGTHAGLYAAKTGSCNSGVVIRQDEVDGPLTAQGTWCDGQGHFAQIIILSPIVATPRGIAVQVAGRRRGSAGAGESFYVTPVSP